MLERERYERAAIADGEKVARDISGSILERLARRLRDAGGLAALAGLASIFGEDLREDFAGSIEGTLLTADLLGRSQPRRQVEGSLRFQDPRSTVVLEPLQPTEALDSFRELVTATPEQLESIGDRYRRYAFTVAEAADVSTVERVRALVDRALAEGMTERDFLRAAAELIPKATQSYLSTVYQTNLSSSYMAGRWQGLQEDPFTREALSIYRYVTMGDILVRPTHAALHNWTASQDHPQWKVIWPPNGFNCRCDVIAVTAEEARRSGWDPQDQAPEGGIPDKGFDFNPGIVDEAVADELKRKISGG